MIDSWQPGTQYNYGARVLYEGVQYQIIQPHRSQSDWTPPATPALWGRLQDGDCHRSPHHENSGQWAGDCKSDPCAPSCDQPPPPPPPQQQQQPYHSPQGGVQGTHGESQKHWYDIDDKKKQELEIGGGLLAGVGALAAGVYAYNQHSKKGEEQRAHAWSQGNWLRDAEQRTQAFRRGNYPAPVAWILTEGKNIPPDAIEGGFERGAPLYICRAYCEAMVGKACSVFKKGGVVDKYEILVGNPQAVRWVNVSGQFNLAALGGLRPVEGGREPGGAPQYIAQAPYHGAVHPGKACESFGDGCFIPYDSTEKKVKEYAVLCYN
ncbi:carbohydrate-binding module family 12 protein [Suillus bovinus]|uniref:carbohydrate-binding module family 12 protein n=1 Tax=Suillus bovinus TaxID=48563 RepID=UPI001B87EB53|nr:carbohydrate-binding module family 12 protein [Suillus bovinus]KAG2146418.1 carbohydrate-binding module family 12 protein [Suillus bovinus]